MDIKKINIKKVDVWGKLNELVDKIPESISSLLKKIGIGIFVIGCLVSIYDGYQKGFSSAKEEGMELAKDTKTLFLEDIERTYNRKRKDVRAGGDLTNLLSGDDYKPQKYYQSYSRESESREGNQPLSELKNQPLEREGALQELKGNGDTPPIADIQNNAGVLYPENSINEPRKNYRPLKDEFPTQNQNAGDFYSKNLRETPNYNQQVLDRKPNSEENKLNYIDPTVLQNDSDQKANKARLISPRKGKSSDRIITPE